MKRKKPPVEKATSGTVLGVRSCVRSATSCRMPEREKLGGEFLKLYYGGQPLPATTHRR